MISIIKILEIIKYIHQYDIVHFFHAYIRLRILFKDIFIPMEGESFTL
jgi:hypothetical protein